MTKIDDLKKEAEDLGIVFNKTIGEAKLAEKIEAHYVAQEGPAPVIKEVVEPIVNTMRTRANVAEKLARVSHVVVITDNDQRENHLTTTVSVNCGNDYFDLGTKRIPLNVPVELEQGFIDVLKEIRIPMHTADRKTGLGKTVIRTRYAIANEDELKKD